MMVNKIIVLYGNDGCIFCSKAKEWLEKHNLIFIEKDIRVKENFKEFETYNVFGVPLVVITDAETNEETLINGFTATKYEETFLQ